MRLIAPQLLLLLLVFTGTSVAYAQTAQSSPTKIPGTIVGRVTAGAQPAEAVEVLIRPAGTAPGMNLLQFAPANTTTTDSDGRYRLSNLAPGSYLLSVHAPAYVIDGGNDWLSPGKTVNVREGETVENINISLTLGGVFTGKVTDPDGRPVIGEVINLKRLLAEGKSSPPGFADALNMWQTDDRGIYRVFGLEPGRYLIAAGASSEGAIVARSSTYYRRTFYPGTVEEKDAKQLEIKSGDVLENVDIKLARASMGKTFYAKGRVVEVDSGKAVAGVMIGYTATRQGAPRVGIGNSTTNSLGEFLIEGLIPNTYRAYTIGLTASENYGEQIDFEIIDNNVEGLEIKMLKGVSISGVAVIEGSNDPRLREKLTKVQLYAQSAEANSPNFSISFPGIAPISENGVFRIAGVRPGRIRVSANTMMAEGITLVRVEHNGVEVRELQLNAGEHATGVRLVFALANGSISGRLEVRDGTLPSNVSLIVMATREGSSVPESDPYRKMVNVDPRGQFLIESLTPGTYKLRVFPRDAAGGTSDFPRIEQTVVVGNTQQEVTMVVDLRKR